MQQRIKLLFFTLIATTSLLLEACEETRTPNEIERRAEEISDAIAHGNLLRVQGIMRAHPEVARIYENPPYFTPFHRAATCNQPEIIKYLASHTNINIDARLGSVPGVSTNGETALHIACHRGYSDTAWALLMAGADPYIRDNDNNTPLMSGHYWERLATLFLIYGIALFQEDVDQLVRRTLGDSDRWRSAPQLTITLWRTCIADALNKMHILPKDLAYIPLLLEYTTTPDIPNAEVQAWVNVFHAIEIGDLETVQEIVKTFPRVRRATDKQDRDLFTAATQHRQVAIMSFLVLNGFHGYVDASVDSMSGVEWAAHHGHLDVARFFLCQTDADIEGQRRTTTPPHPTPLTRAARSHQLEMVKLFLEFGIRLFPEDLIELKALDARTGSQFSPQEIIENMRNTLMTYFKDVEHALLDEEYDPQLHLPTDIRRIIVSILATPRLTENGDILQTKTG